MKLDGYSFSGDKTVSFNSNAVVSIGLQAGYSVDQYSRST